jgi:hypothetical protein
VSHESRIPRAAHGWARDARHTPTVRPGRPDTRHRCAYMIHHLPAGAERRTISISRGRRGIPARGSRDAPASLHAALGTPRLHLCDTPPLRDGNPQGPHVAQAGPRPPAGCGRLRMPAAGGHGRGRRAAGWYWQGSGGGLASASECAPTARPARVRTPGAPAARDCLYRAGPASLYWL